MAREEILKAFLAISEQSKTLQTWSLSILGGSIAVILGSSYIRPVYPRIRWIYFLFIPGWVFLVISIYYGHDISRNYITALFIKENLLQGVEDKLGSSFLSQIQFFGYGLITFSVWLVIYIFWWILGQWEIKTCAK